MGPHQLPGKCSTPWSGSEKTNNSMQQIDAESRPAILAPAYTGHFRVVLDTPRGLLPLHPGHKALNHSNFPLDASHNDPKSQAGVQATRQQTDQTFELRRNVYSQNNAQVPPSAAAAAEQDQSQNGEQDSSKKVDEGFGCDVCGVDCTRQRYHHLTQRDFELCPACYHEGRFPSNMSTADFVRLDQATTPPGPDAKADPWSAQERLLLLEGLEMHDEDWDKVAAHVGGRRSKEECIQHFLQLPIEDQYLAQNDADLGPLKYRHPAVGGNENPVLSVVSFLASIVDPKVAAAAAEQAKSALMDKLKSDVSSDKKSKTETDEQDAGDTEMTEDEPEKEKENGHEAAGDAEDEKTEEIQEVEAEAPIKRAARAAIGSAAAKAHLLTQAEDRELHQLVRSAVNEQVKKLDGKMAAFSEMEHLLELERRSVEQARSQLMTDRLNLVSHMNRLQELGRRCAAHLPEQMREEIASWGVPGFSTASSAMPSKAVKVDQPEGAEQPPPPAAEGLSFGQIE